MTEFQTVARREVVAAPFGERRASVRFAGNWETFCSAPRDGMPEDVQATISDISLEGLGLVLDQPIEPRTFLDVTLQNASRGFWLWKLVQVVRVQEDEPGPYGGQWRVGCVFVNALTEDELRTLLT